MGDVDESQTLRRVGFILAGAVIVGLVDALSVGVGARLGLGVSGVIGLVLMSGLAATMLSVPVFLVAWGVKSISFRSPWTAAWTGAVVPAACWLAVATVEHWPEVGGLMVALPASLALLGGAVAAMIVVTRGAERSDLALGSVAVVVASALVVMGRPVLATTLPSQQDRPNVLLVTVSSLRADRMGAHRTDTAALDRLVAEGARFELAVTPSLDTHHAAAALLHGQQPWSHHVAKDDHHGVASLAGLLGERGYATGAFVGNDKLGRHVGLDAGFGVYDDDHGWPKGQPWLFPYRLAHAAGLVHPPADRRATDVVERALRFMQSRDSAWFTWVHLDDPTAPYTPPSPWDERYYEGRDPRDPGQRSLDGGHVASGHGSSIRGVTDADYVESRYDGEVAFADAQINRLLTAIDDLEAAQHTLVVVAGTRGEVMQDGAHWFGHEELAPASVDVPLLMRWPGRIAVGSRVESPFELVDIGATILDFAGVASPHLGESHSAKGVIEGVEDGRTYARTADHETASIREFGVLWTLDHGELSVDRVEEDGPLTVAWTDERILASVEHLAELTGAAVPTVDYEAIREQIAPTKTGLTPGFAP